MRKSNKDSIDIDKVAENPGLLPYAHHVGSAIIKPLDKGRTKGVAMSAMYQQTDSQLNQIKDQVELLIKQAQILHDRISISERIYQADSGFKAVLNKRYYVYQRKSSGSTNFPAEDLNGNETTQKKAKGTNENDSNGPESDASTQEKGSKQSTNKKEESWVLSMISPEEWGENGPYLFIASCELLADHTWDVIEKNPDVSFL